MRFYILIFLIFIFLSCDDVPKETTTRGKLYLFITESIAPPIIDGVNEFLRLYQANGAEIFFSIVPSDTVAKHFVSDSGKIAFLPRKLTIDEKEQSKKISEKLNELVVAYDGIAVLINKSNMINQLTTTEIQRILAGAIVKWESLGGGKTTKGKINIYYKDQSDITQYLVKRLNLQNGIKAGFTSTSSDLQTIQLVEKDPLALGFTNLSWIDSSKSSAKIVKIGRTKEDTDTTFVPPLNAIGKYYLPDPAFIHLNYYPFKRAIYMYTYSKVDIAMGFGTFMSTAEGQKLFLKHGILPGTQKIKLRTQ